MVLCALRYATVYVPFAVKKKLAHKPDLNLSSTWSSSSAALAFIIDHCNLVEAEGDLITAWTRLICQYALALALSLSLHLSKLIYTLQICLVSVHVHWFGIHGSYLSTNVLRLMILVTSLPPLCHLGEMESKWYNVQIEDGNCRSTNYNIMVIVQHAEQPECLKTSTSPIVSK